MTIKDIKITIDPTGGAVLRPMTEAEKKLTREDFDSYGEWCVHSWGLNRHTEECMCDCCWTPEKERNRYQK